MDDYANLAYTTVVTPPSPGSSGLSMVVTSNGPFPDPPFNVVVHAATATEAQVATGAEILRVTSQAGTTWTIARAAEGPNSARTIQAGDIVKQSVTAGTLAQLRALMGPRWRIVKTITPSDWNAAIDDGAIEIWTPAVGSIVTDIAVSIGESVNMQGSVIGPFFFQDSDAGAGSPDSFTGAEFILRGGTNGAGLATGVGLGHLTVFNSMRGQSLGVRMVPGPDPDNSPLFSDSRQPQDHYGLPLIVPSACPPVFAIIAGGDTASSDTPDEDNIWIWALIQDAGAV